MPSVKTFFLALSLLSRIPVARYISFDWQSRDYQAVAHYYGAVGLVLSLPVVMLLCLAPLSWQPLFIAAMVLSVWLSSTGGLHLVSVAKSADAYFASHGSSLKAAQVLQDSATGAMGLIAVLFAVLLACGALVQLGSGAVLPIILAMVVGRLAAASYLSATGYAAELDDDGQCIEAEHPILPTPFYWQALAVLGLAALTLSPSFAVVSVVSVIGITMAWRRLWIKLLGGFTGETVSALVVVVEVYLLLLSAVWLA